MYVAHCPLQRFNFAARDVTSNRFCLHETYCTYFCKGNETNFFFKKIQFYKVNVRMSLLCSLKRKDADTKLGFSAISIIELEPITKPAFQKLNLLGLPYDITRFIPFAVIARITFQIFLATMSFYLWPNHGGLQLILATSIWVSQFILKITKFLYRSRIFHSICWNDNLLF